MSTAKILDDSAGESLTKRRAAAVAQGVGSATPVFAARAEGEFVWDVDGRKYIDFAGGIGVLAVGHRHPAVLAAVRRQLDLYTHTSFQVMAYEPYIELAEQLNRLAPFSEPAKTVLLTTGVEAVEAAVKIARVATGRSAVIAFSGAFHGRTHLGMALTGKSLPYKRGLSWLGADVYRIPFPVPQYGVEVADTLRALDTCFRCDLEPTRVAAIIIEPVQGEGGFHVAPPALLQALRRICDEHGIVFIADEIQAGCARTGRMFAIEHSGVEPDLVTVAKSLAGGFPLSGVVGRARIVDAVQPGGLGGTYGGSPIGCAAALAVLNIISQPSFLERSLQIGANIKARLEAFAARAELLPIANIRGLGPMLAFDLVKSRGSVEPDGAAAKVVTTRALQLGLVILSCGSFGETVRILLPLTLSDESLQKAMQILEKALGAKQGGS